MSIASRPLWRVSSGNVLLLALLILLAVTLSDSLEENQSKLGSDNDDATSPIDVYYINLKRRPDRERHMRAEFERVYVAPPKFKVHRFEAIDGLTHEFTKEEAALFQTFDEKFNSSNNTALLKANSLSHLGVWKQVLESDAPYAVVFQDDVQLSSDFCDALDKVIQYNPSDALVTWLGLNNYASGMVSRSAPLAHGKYNPNLASTELPGTQGVIGHCRPNLVSTNSLAYLLTRRGAQVMVQEFGSAATGWTHHTDHAMVEFLDARGVSYISRKVLATTHDDGILGSDIFHNVQEEAAAKHAENMVQTALRYARLKTNDAIVAATKDGDHKPIHDKDDLPWLKGLTVKCEEMKCLFPDCPAPVVTFCFLSWSNKDDKECKVDEDGTTCATINDVGNDYYVMDDLGVRRHGNRKQLLLAAAPSDVTPALAAKVIPAWWVLEAWSSGQHQVQTMSRPRFAVGDAVEVNFSTKNDPLLLPTTWEPAVVAAVGFRQDSWPEGTVATYVVKHQDGRFLTVLMDHPTKIKSRKSSNGSQDETGINSKR